MPKRLLAVLLMIAHVAIVVPIAAAETIYTVQPGDTLTAIADQAGVSVDAIVQLNAIDDPNLIYVGQQLTLPGGDERPAAPARSSNEAPAAPAATADATYVVQPGDTLSAIAAQAGITVDAIVEANGIENPSLIYVGQRLVLPGASGSVASPDSGPAPAPSGGTASAPPPRAAQTGPNSILAQRRLLTYYGNSFSAQMGILGELSKEELVARLKRHAAEYQAAGGKPVQPAIHFIATVAQGSPGSDGMWRARMPMEEIEEYARLAEQNGMLLIVDVQPGLSTVAEEIEPYRELLTRPYVHLAIDPEFDMAPGQQPGVQLGSMSADSINHAIRWLADIVEQHNLPNKVLIVHQFTASMIRNKEAIVDDPRVDVVIDMDGFGGQAIKRQHYQWYVAEERVEFAGIKLFFKQDTNLMTPAEVLGLAPPPDVIIYQ